MSRDFKQEYEQHMNEQTPDLWARIEANLPVKEVPEVNGTTVVGFDAENNKADTPEVSQMRPRKGISRTWLTYAMTAAAALLICVLAVPVLRSAQGGNSESANFMAKDAAMPEMVMEDGAADAGEAENGSVRYNADGAAPEAAVEEECVVEQEADKEYMMADDSGGSTNMETTGASGTTDYSNSADNGGNIAGAEVKTGTEEMKQTALWAEVTIREIYEQDGKVLYRGELTGREVTLVLDEDITGEAVLQIGEMYELSLEAAEENMDWDYVIIGIE